MMGWISGNKFTDGVKVYLLGCTCTRPRRRKREIESDQEEINRIKQLGKRGEVR